MSPAKRATKKSKKSKTAKKPVRTKKSVRAKKPARKKKPNRKKPVLMKRLAAPALKQRQTQAPDDSLGEWPADNDEDTVELEISEDDEIPPEYGGSE